MLTLLSSWIVNPLGILVAQRFGVANTEVVILVLLATGACVPFQLLMNECIAAAESRGQVRASRQQLTLLISIQSAACALTVAVLAAQRFSMVQIAFVVGLLAINTGLSHRISLRYFRLVTESAVSIRTSVVVGAIPGVTSLLLYLAYCLAMSLAPGLSATFILASTVVPALVQWQYLRAFSVGSDGHANPLVAEILPRPATGWLLISTIGLATLAAGTTRLRETVAHLNTNHVALLLVTLNSMLSLINTSTRATFLSRAGVSQRGLLAMAVVATAATGAGAFSLGWRAAPLIALVAAQLAIAWVIEAARHVPVSPFIQPRQRNGSI